ncbi:MAG: hypothetical protein LBS31_08685, partial [Candidatus Adiutrix sp.]|nr:hypothetical protein [Candidatus Adiutrix sp.]
MKKAAAIFCLVFFAVSVPAGAVSRPETGAPDNLAAWESWALYGHEEQYLCPDSGRGKNICAWPVTLSLDLGAQGGSFAAVFELFKEGRFPLPGGRGAWPTNVADESGQAVAVLGPAESPEVWLPAGRHRLNGEFRWRRPPETMSLPLGFTLNIKIDGAPLDFPPMEVDYDSGRARLWLNRADEPEPLEARLAEQEDSLTVSVNRLARDSQPMMITSVLKLVVSGKPREVLIENALLPDVHASFLSSPLPAQLAEGGLRVKVKPGVYEIVLEARSTGRSEKLGPAPAGSGPEYWAFQAQPDLRLVEISGAPQVDASQADVYPPWRHLPIYVLTPGESLAFDVIRRGDPEPPPDQLRLNRECWLDYDGGGLSCRDRLSGLMNRQWHLNVTSPFTLAQASLGGQPQVITWQTDS